MQLRRAATGSPLARDRRVGWWGVGLVLALCLGAGGPGAWTREAEDLAAVRKLLQDPQPRARAGAARRLAGREDRAALELLLRCLEDPHPYVRRAAAGVLGTLGEAARATVDRRLARLRSAEGRVAAARVATLWADGRGEGRLLALLRDREAEVREAALRGLAEEPDAGRTEHLVAALADPSPGVRATAGDLLLGLAPERLPVERLAGDADFRCRMIALEGSVARDPEAAAVAVLRGLDDAVWSIRLRAAELARVVPDARLLASLIEALRDPRSRVAEAAHRALCELTGIPFDPDPELWQRWVEGDGRGFDPRDRPQTPQPRPPTRHRTVARPRFLDLDVASRHVAFVLDASGSMAARRDDGMPRWGRVVRSLEEALDRMDGARVNVYRFADDVEAAFPRATRLDRASRTRLRSWLTDAEPGGRTALYDGLAAALRDGDVDTLVLLSDGAPSAGTWFTKTDLLAGVRLANRFRRARIDVIDVGGGGVAARWQDALRQIARESGGVYARR